MKQIGMFDEEETKLRPLRVRQENAIEAVRQAVKEGHKRIIIQGPCGFGKTLLAAHLITSALEKRRRPLFTCPALSLIDQTLKSFEAEGIHDIGVMQAQHGRTDKMARVQIASVQTLVRRDRPEADFLMLDEIHMRFVLLNEMLDGPWKDKIAIGLTATPWAKGMGLRWTKLIIPATIPQLIEEGFLTPTNLYIPDEVAVRGDIDVEKGEFTDASASKAMRESRIVGNIVDTWKKLGPGEKTFMFCVNREHAREQMGAFIDSGIPFGYIDANTNVPDRELEFEKMRHGDIAGIASVGCLIAGVDEDVRCLIDAAPTNSETRHVQKWGRGIRTADGKEALIGLDHAGNNSEEGLGLFWEIYHDHLDTHKPSDKATAYEGDPKPPKPKRCPVCHVLMPKGHAVCAKCGSPLPANSGLVHLDGELALYGVKKKVKTRQYTMEEKQAWYSGFLWMCRERGKSEGAAAHRYKEKFGVWPNQLRKEPRPPSFEVEQFDKHCRIRYAKGRAKGSQEAPDAKA
jgi:DNA repair protein RadD